jgi:trans-aconitate methyltransferase
LRSLGYNQRSSQQKRFDALCELGDFSGKRLLDVGCGLGDFLAYLRERDMSPDYTGVDLVPEMIERCNERFKNQPGPQCLFETGDTLEYVPQGKFDYVVASGIFGLLSENAAERIAPTLRQLFSWCTTGVAVNFLSQRANRHDPKCLYIDPARMLSLALDLTPTVRLSHNYLPNDFTIYLEKRPAWIFHHNGQVT